MSAESRNPTESSWRLGLVVGTPRSGTTLLVRCLSELPGVWVTPETHFFTALLRTQRPDFPVGPDVVRKLLETLPSLPVAKGLRLDPDSVIRLLPDSGANPLLLFRALVRVAAAEYGFGERGTEPRYIFEKTPSHLHFADWLIRQDSSASVVVIRRGAKDNVSSLTKAPFVDATSMDLFGRWWSDQLAGNRLLKRFPKRVLAVEFNDLVGAYSKVQEDLRSFLDLPPGLTKPVVPILPWEEWKLKAQQPPGSDDAGSAVLSDRECGVAEWLDAVVKRGPRPDTTPRLTDRCRVFVAMVRQVLRWRLTYVVARLTSLRSS